MLNDYCRTRIASTALTHSTCSHVFRVFPSSTHFSLERPASLSRALRPSPHPPHELLLHSPYLQTRSVMIGEENGANIGDSRLAGKLIRETATGQGCLRRPTAANGGKIEKYVSGGSLLIPSGEQIRQGNFRKLKFLHLFYYFRRIFCFCLIFYNIIGPFQKMASPEQLSRTNPHGYLLESCASSPQELCNTVPRPHLLNGRVQDVCSRQIMTFSVVFAMVLLAQLVLLYLYVEYDLALNPYASTFLQGSSVCAVLAALLLAVRYYTQIPEYELIDYFPESLGWVAFKIIVLLLSPYEFLEETVLQMGSINHGQVHDELKLNHLLAVFVFLRTGCFAGVLLACSHYMHPRATRINRLFGIASSTAAALKAIFKDAPARTIIALYVSSSIIFTFSFRVSEAAVYASSSAGTIYSNMAWMTMVTMTTLGFGDYSPQTMLGRGIGGLCAIWGALIVSVMVVVVTSAFALDRKESQTLRIINKINQNTELEQVAAKVLRSALPRLWRNLKHATQTPPPLPERKLFNHFRVMRRAYRAKGENGNRESVYNQFSEVIEGTARQISVLTANNLSLVNLLTEEYVFKKELKRNSKLDLPKIKLKFRKK